MRQKFSLFNSWRQAFGLSLVLAALCACKVRGAETVCCTGVTEPVFDVALGFPVPGIATAIKFKEGDFVQTNDVIIELDKNLEELDADRRRLVMDNRKADWEGTKTVFDKTGSISRDELLKKESEYKVAVAEYQMAEETLRRRSLAAPRAGIIAELNLRVGEACTAYQPVVRVVDTRQCYFISNIEAKAAGHLKKGQTISIEIEDDAKPIKVEGKIVFISPVVDQASGLQKIKAVFENPDGKVRPGLAGRMTIE